MCFLKKIPFLFFILLIVQWQSAIGQTYGNEWIDYEKQYWKFPVIQNGIIRITYNDLFNGGFPVGSIDPRYISLYGRGKELEIYVAGEDDGDFSTADYIEFNGRKNDAWLDSVIYDEPTHLPNPAYSLFNDTAWYFISINDNFGLRRSLSDANNFADFTPITHCLYKSELEFHNEYLIGEQDINGISLPLYEEAEGWFDFKFPKGGSHEKFVATSNAYTGNDAPAAKAQCVSASASLAIGFPNHHLQLGWGDPLNVTFDTTYYGYQLNNLTFEIPTAQLGTQTRIVHRSIDDLGVASDYQAVSYVAIEYPRTLDFTGLSEITFSIPGNVSATHSLIEIAGAQTSSRLFVLKGHQLTEILMTESQGVFKALVPMSNSARIELLFTNQVNTLVGGVEPVTQTAYFTNYLSNEVDNCFLIITHPQLWAAAQNYAAWRNNGTTQSLVVNVEELYMQYTYGIDKNPLAIRRFCNQLITGWSEKPDYLFLMGKSIHDASINGVIGSRNDPEKHARNLVPTWGYPGSDIAFTAGLAGTLNQPAIATGRLSANNTSQVLEYLNKVIEHETQPPALWQKNMLHFGGGTIDYEQQMFRGFLNGYKAIAQDTSIGAQVYSFFKNTSDPIQMNVSDSIQLLINQGVSVMTFFGHASSTGFDQNIDSPLNYNNQGKYPLLIGNSCYTGNIHLGTTESASETFVLVPDRGVIGFLAKSDIGLPGFLDLYTNNFYRQICQYNYGHSIGECMQKAIESFQVDGNIYRSNVAYNFALHGDPAIKLHHHEKPDYSVSAQDVFFTPQEITASQPTINVNIVVKNSGKATNDNVGIELVRHYPNGVDSSYVFTADRILNTDTVIFTIPNNTDIAAGENSFDIFIDYPINLIDELDNSGNNVVLSKSLIISSGDLFPVSPYAFQVTDNPQPVLYASTGFSFEQERTYLIQADTTDLFNSPMLHATSITHGGGVIEWPLPFALTDSMVVFWRCTADSISPENTYRWHNSSFQFIANEQGWGQDHFFQFRENNTTNLGYFEDQRRWSFSPTTANLKCEVYGAANSSFEGLATRYQLNLNVQEYGGYGYTLPALMVAVLDSATFIPWESNYNGENPGYDFGNTMISANARQRAERYFIFQQHDQSQLAGFANMIESIPENNYLLIYTWEYALKENWTALAPEVYDAFESLGAGNIVASADSVPFIFFVQKGHPETAVEIVGNQSDDYLILEVPLEGSLGSGNMSAPIAGPAQSWGKAEWNYDALETTQGDSTRIRIHGITWEGADVILADLPQTPSLLSDLESIAPAAQYPFLRFESRLHDFASYTAPQTDRWHLIYDLAPECAIDPSEGFYISADTVEQGGFLEVAIAMRNISEIEMDSLLVSYIIEDQNRYRHHIPYALQNPLLPGEVLFDTLYIDTRNFPGINTLIVEANPIDSATNQPHQLEQYHFNNFAKIDFFVQSDLTNPILDVTFDGQHILNGDIISSEPEIVVMLDDESAYFILDEDADTSNFKLYIRGPESDFQPIYFSSESIDWTLASAPANKFKINYRPKFEADGKYRLRVQATDKSGNLSGDHEYEIDFEIITHSTITEVLNYPNPFSTRTQFVFTVTGTEPPDQFKIQIMTVSGHIVREITQDELGPLRIGRNLSEYWWDGTDEYGDRLANGIYLYRVIAKLNGQDIELNATSASRFFNHGFGKMYLMR